MQVDSLCVLCCGWLCNVMVAMVERKPCARRRPATPISVASAYAGLPSVKPTTTKILFSTDERDLRLRPN